MNWISRKKSKEIISSIIITAYRQARAIYLLNTVIVIIYQEKN